MDFELILREIRQNDSKVMMILMIMIVNQFMDMLIKRILHKIYYGKRKNCWCWSCSVYGSCPYSKG
jgi:hypothetical protein